MNLQESLKQIRDRLEAVESHAEWDNGEVNRIFVLNARQDIAKLLEVVTVLSEEIIRLENTMYDDFHRRVCLQSRGCHCKRGENSIFEQAEMILRGTTSESNT